MLIERADLIREGHRVPLQKSDNGAPADEKSRSLTPAGDVHACPTDFAIIAGCAECNLRGDAQRAFIALRLSPVPIALALPS